MRPIPLEWGERIDHLLEHERRGYRSRLAGQQQEQPAVAMGQEKEQAGDDNKEVCKVDRIEQHSLLPLCDVEWLLLRYLLALGRSVTGAQLSASRCSTARGILSQKIMAKWGDLLTIWRK